jgi:ADP-ribose pyrophosphatase
VSDEAGSGDTPPVIRHSRRLVCPHGKWDVYFDHVSGAAGQEVTDYLVLAPKGRRDDRVTGVTVLPVWQGRIVLQRVYRHPLDAWVWEAPRGFLDRDEEPETAALRELTEETGLTGTAARLVPLGRCAPEAATIIGRGALFAALDCVFAEDSVRDREELGLGELGDFTLEEALALADASGIEDATTLAALYRYARKAPGL